MLMPTNICCEHAFLVEENTGLKSQVQKGLATKSKKKKNRKNKNMKKKTMPAPPSNAIAYEKKGRRHTLIRRKPLWVVVLQRSKPPNLALSKLLTHPMCFLLLRMECFC
jgi:hypothetical protein